VRDIAKEIQKYFDVEVNPETMKTKVARIAAGSNEPPQKEEPTVKHKTSQKVVWKRVSKKMDKLVQWNKTNAKPDRKSW
jgi:hypothetical protein